MTLEEFLALMQEDLKNEYRHLHFYLQASFVLVGPERLHVGAWLASQADSELGHVREFASKVRAFGLIPTTEYIPPFNPTPSASNTVVPTGWAEILSFALSLEQEVVKNFHERLVQAEALVAKTGKHKDLVLFYEEQIEDSQADIDEIVKFLGASRS